MTTLRVALAIALITFAIVLDVMTLYRNLQWNRTGIENWGFGCFPWLLYNMVTLLFIRNFGLRVKALLGLTAFHLLCTYFIPVLHRKWLERGQ